MAEYKAKSLAAKCGLGVFVLAVVLVTVAFCTPFWLQSDPRFYGASFEKLGLWTYCFRSYSSPYPVDQRRYYTGCRWLFDPFTAGWSDIRSLLTPSFFVAVQFFYTMCFILLVVAIIVVGMYLLCFRPSHSYFVLLLRIIGVVLLSSALLGTIAVIIFGAKGNDHDWMPGWENNYLSWSYALAVVGVAMEWIAGILFLVEARVQKKKRWLREAHGAYSLETKAPSSSQA